MTLNQEQSDEQADLQPTATHYALKKTLGAGAMGEIWLAQDTGLRRQVAYKRMHAHIATQKQALSRFLREMQITAQLDHPHIVPVYECELNPDGSLAYAMKLVRGRTLKDVLLEKRALLEKGQPITEDYTLQRLLEHFLSVCEAIHFAHSKGVIHRDLKPVNLMIGEFGEVYVMDWGIARRIGGFEAYENTGPDTLSADTDVDETRVGQILGTPRYMSPQQAAGKNKELDGRSDQFALGLILFEVLTLRPAFQASNAVELIKKVLKVELQPFVAFKGEKQIPRELKAIALKALSKRPEDRYESTAALAKDIRRWQQGQAVSASPDNAWQRVTRWMGQHRQATLAAAMAVLAGVMFSVGSAVYRQQAELARERVYTAFVNEVLGQASSQAQRIDSHFLKMQGLLDMMAASALEYLEQGAPSLEPIYPQSPFNAPNQINSALYGGKISLDWPTSGFSPHKQLSDMNGKLSRLLPLRHVLRDVLLRSHTDQPEKLTQTQIQELIGGKGTPIMWAHASLEEGVIYMFPGIGFNTPGYDARTRPWYKNTVGTHGARWGSPYFDPLSGALLPCTRALYDHNQRFMGVAGIDLRFQYVIDHLLTLKRDDFKASYLLNDKGEIIIRSADAQSAQTDKALDLTKGFETPAYPDQKLQAAIKAKQSGGWFEQKGQLLLYSRLNTLGWYFVAEIAEGN